MATARPVSEATVNVPDALPNFQYAESEGQNSSTLTSYQQKLRLAATGLATGIYRVDWYMEARNVDPADAVEVRLEEQDSTTHAECRFYSGNPGGVNWLDDFINFSGFKHVSISTSTRDFDLDYQSVGGGSCQVRRARISLTRVS
jgi:hypothetical protein